MKDLNYYKEQIKQKRKTTNFMDYLKEITSWLSFTYYRNNGLVSRYPTTDRVQIINFEDFEKNRDDLVKSGLDYNYKEKFFYNFGELFKNIKLPNLIFYGVNENAIFSDQTFNSKNVYLSSTTIIDCENIAYNFSVNNSSNIYNSLFIKNNCDIVYFSRGITKSFKIFFSSYIFDSNNIWFSSNLIGCSECIFCDNLENQKFCINNKKLEKEEYFKQKEKILKNKNEFEKYFSKIEKKGKNYGSENINGNYIVNSEDVENGGYVISGKKSRNSFFAGGGIVPNENLFDVFSVGGAGGDDFYGVISAGKSDNLYCSTMVANSSNIFYSYYLDNCSYCIGCIGLKNKSYCILNKQYSKQEWEELSSKIFESMVQNGSLGEFFPAKLNPFYFNDTVAGLIGGFNKEEIVKEGFMWRDEKIKVDIPDESLVVEVKELDNYEGFDNNGEWKINPEILKKVIKDENGDYYRIVKLEYDFLVKHGLPLPRLHWLERIKVNFGV